MRAKNNAKTLTILSALYILHAIPIIGYYTPAIVFLLVTLLLYVVLALNASSGSFVRLLALSLPVISIPFLRLIQVIVVGERDFYLESYSFIQVLIYPMLGLYVLRSKNITFCKTILLIFLVSYSITAVTTIIGCYLFPDAARALTGNQDNLALYGQYKRMNIGDFHFVYFITLTLPLIIGSIRYKLIKKPIGILLVVLVIVAVYYSAYTTALLFSILALLLFFVPKNIAGNKLFFLGIVAFVILMMSSTVLSTILSSVSGNINNEDIASRLADMSTVFSGGTVESLDAESDMGARYDLFSRSWQAFLQNPIIGSWSLRAIGGHSFFLDTIGLFGLLGLLCLVWMYVRSFKLFLAPFRKNSWYAFLLSTFFLIIFQAILNPQPTIKVLSFVLPMYACLMDKETRRCYLKVDKKNCTDKGIVT